MNSESLDIANAVECAGEQDKFWQFVVFATKNRVKGSKQSLLEAASQVIVPDTQKFEGCVDSLQYKDRIENHRQQARQQGVSSTPTFFINSKKIRGAQPFAEFKRVIESQINS
jgi:protein-disulfide isomerase